MQCLPIVRHGNRVKIVETCIKCCELWPYFEQLKLIENVRASDHNKGFCVWLIKLGNGELSSPEFKNKDIIEIPSTYLTKNR